MPIRTEKKSAHNFLSLTGTVFGYLTVVKREYPAVLSKQGNAVWLCQCKCGKTVVVAGNNLTSGNTRSCGCYKSERLKEFQVGKKHHNWKGGRKLDDKGYVHVRLRENGISHYVREHILVMERRLGRKLLPAETVHHVNGIHGDNRDKNLELWATNHPAGQRVVDLIKWAVQLLETYPPNKNY